MFLSQQMIKSGKEVEVYGEILNSLFMIASYEKDYKSAYAYNTELLTFLIRKIGDNSEIWKSECVIALFNHSFLSNLLGKFDEGEQYSLEALKVDSTKHIAYTKLAAAYLFQGKVEEAEKLYRQFKEEFRDAMLDDFAEFERLGVIPEERKKDVERIKAVLKE